MGRTLMGSIGTGVSVSLVSRSHMVADAALVLVLRLWAEAERQVEDRDRQHAFERLAREALVPGPALGVGLTTEELGEVARQPKTGVDQCDVGGAATGEELGEGVVRARPGGGRVEVRPGAVVQRNNIVVAARDPAVHDQRILGTDSATVVTRTEDRGQPTAMLKGSVLRASGEAGIVCSGGAPPC